MIKNSSVAFRMLTSSSPRRRRRRSDRRPPKTNAYGRTPPNDGGPARKRSGHATSQSIGKLVWPRQGQRVTREAQVGPRDFEMAPSGSPLARVNKLKSNDRMGAGAQGDSARLACSAGPLHCRPPQPDTAPRRTSSGRPARRAIYLSRRRRSVLMAAVSVIAARAGRPMAARRRHHRACLRVDAPNGRLRRWSAPFGPRPDGARRRAAARRKACTIDAVNYRSRSPSD
jgi:hypothetical protein